MKRNPCKPLFARVPQGAKTCAFCAMLASRGFVYADAEKAGALGQYHKDCDCEIIPSWGKKNPKIEGYDPDKLYDAYLKARDSLGKENPTLEEILDAMRHTGGYTDSALTGMEKQPLEPFTGNTLDALNQWGLNDYVNIRRYQNGTLHGLPNSLVNLYREEAEAIEKAISGHSTKKTLYRGVSLNASDWQKTLNAFPGEELNEHALASWTTDTVVARDFAQPATSLDKSIILINRSGGQNLLSLDKATGENRMEAEYISSGRNCYRVISVTDTTMRDIDPTLSNEPVILVEVEQYV